MRLPVKASCITRLRLAASVCRPAPARRILRLYTATGMTQKGSPTNAMSVHFKLTMHKRISLVRMLMGCWIIVTIETPIMLCRTLTSPTRDINSPVLLRVRKLAGKLSRCSNKRTRRSHKARNATHPIK